MKRKITVLVLVAASTILGACNSVTGPQPVHQDDSVAPIVLGGR